jgi:hypothetical protein
LCAAGESARSALTFVMSAASLGLAVTGSPRAQTRLSATGGLWVLSKLLDENELDGAVLSVFMVTIILTTKPVDSRGLKRTQEDSDSLKSK